MDDMRAYRIHRFGEPEALQLDRVPVPEPRAGEVLVRIDAASVNPVDLKTCKGVYPAVTDAALPFVPGRDFVGTVERVGPGVQGWQRGDAVYGFVGQGQGCYAEFAVVPAEGLARRPAQLDTDTAAAVPLAALTAWQGLFDHGKLAAGERVLIHGGSGAVGQFAVQFARARDAEVLATASGAGVERVRALGADVAIDYTQRRFEEVAHEVDLVLDLVNGDTQARSWSVLKRGGALVSALKEPSQTEASAHGARAMRYTAQPNGEQLTRIGAMLDRGQVKVRVVERHGFDHAREALAHVGSGHTGGKIVIEVRRQA